MAYNPQAAERAHKLAVEFFSAALNPPPQGEGDRLQGGGGG